MAIKINRLKTDFISLEELDYLISRFAFQVYVVGKHRVRIRDINSINPESLYVILSERDLEVTLFRGYSAVMLDGRVMIYKGDMLAYETTYTDAGTI